MYSYELLKPGVGGFSTDSLMGRGRERKLGFEVKG